MFLPFLLLLSLLSFAFSARLEGNCVAGDAGLSWLAPLLSANAAISCQGSGLATYSADRYWGSQYGKNASVVIFPATAKDVSYAVQAASKTPLGKDFAFVCGAHSQTGASSSSWMVLDLSWMNTTAIINGASLGLAGVSGTLVSYQGGANWGQVNKATAGTGKIAVGARVSNVGVGGFSTGGGIGFLAGAYGYAIDRLVAMEVVLANGQIVTATATNTYSDLFWALQGGGGQFGIVTMFYQKAADEPSFSTFSINFVANDSLAQARTNTAAFFANHTDPFSLMYYVIGLFPSNPLDPANRDFAIRTALVTAYFKDPANPRQLSHNDTFAPLLSGLNTTFVSQLTLPYAVASEQFDTFFPYGFRRGFWGPQITNVTPTYLETIYTSYQLYIAGLVANGDSPATALYALQYMHPGLNGNLPTSDSATAWPHSVAGHQTLFSPAWLLPKDDLATTLENTALNQITYAFQAKTGPFIADYPNYISPEAGGKRVWGGNVARLISIKQKYDPSCKIHNGRVFASVGCILGGWANIFDTL